MAATKLPASIRIGHRKIAILMAPSDMMDADGDYSPLKARIRVRDDLVPHDQAETLIHEILHACWPTTPVVGDIEEVVVTTLAEHWSEVMLYNPSLMAWLQHSLEQ